MIVKEHNIPNIEYYIDLATEGRDQSSIYEIEILRYKVWLEEIINPYVIRNNNSPYVYKLKFM